MTGVDWMMTDLTLLGFLERTCHFDVASVRIERNPFGGSLGSALVRFANSDDADRCLQQLGDLQKWSSRLTARRIPNLNDPATNELFVRLPHNIVYVRGSTDVELIREEFQRVADVFAVDVISGRAVVVFRENIDGKFDKYHGQFRPMTRVYRELVQLILPSIEKRTVYVTSFPPTINRDQFRAHMAVVGDIVYFDIEAAPGRPPYAYVQYVNADAQRLATAVLDCTAIEAGQTPIRVFPFLDSKLYHRPAGLVQLNSVPLTESITSLKKWASQFGETLATAICPAGFGAGVGFVLFKLWEAT
jgi:hypothetical protein